MPGPSRSGRSAHIAPISGTTSGLPTGPRLLRSMIFAAILRYKESATVVTFGWMRRHFNSVKASATMPLEKQMGKPAAIRSPGAQRAQQCRSRTGKPLASGISLSRHRIPGTAICWQPASRVRAPRCAGSVCYSRRCPSSAFFQTRGRCGRHFSIR